MTVALASAWRPRGELPRFLNLLPQLEQVYRGIVISVPPEAAGSDDVRNLELPPGVFVAVTADWSHGRHAALSRALETNATHIHYADFDRILHWVETRAQEWRETVAAIETSDCLIIGRTAQAFQTHPQVLQQTEKIINSVLSHLLGKPLDLGAGSRGFSRRAAQFLMANSPPGRALGTDAEWPVLLHRAGFALDHIEVDGLDWESADHRQQRVADAEEQRHTAEMYDADPKRWARRVQIAQEIVHAGLDAMQRPFDLKRET